MYVRTLCEGKETRASQHKKHHLYTVLCPLGGLHFLFQIDPLIFTRAR